jgi:hypothetical protein
MDLIRSVIDHQLRDDAQPALVRRGEERLEIGERAIVRIHIVVVSDVVAIIAQGGRIKREQPDRCHAKILEIIELADQAPEIAHSVAGAVLESLYVQLVDDRVFVPKGIGSEQIVGHLLTFAKKLAHAIWWSILAREFSRQQSLFCQQCLGMKKLLLTVLLALLSLGWSSPVFAQWSSDPMINLGVAVKPDDQVQPKIRSTPNGGCYISWFDNDPSGDPPFGYDVDLQRLDKHGVAQFPAGGIRLADLGMSSTQDYGLDVDAHGNALLAFLDDRRGRHVFVTVMKVGPGGNQLFGKYGREVSHSLDFIGNRRWPPIPRVQLWLADEGNNLKFQSSTPRAKSRPTTTAPGPDLFAGRPAREQRWLGYRLLGLRCRVYQSEASPGQ